MRKPTVKSDFTCQFCKKTFKRERTLESHACETRRRFRAKSEKTTQIAFVIYQQFYKSVQHSSTIKTFDDFIRSQFYGAMIKFSSYCINTNVLNAQRYGTYLIKKGIPIDKWNKDSVYQKFVLNFIKVEPVEEALTRSIQYSIEWSTSHNEQAKNLFREGAPTRITQAIQYGRISPWIIYMSDSGTQFLEKLHQSDQTRIWNMIDPTFWADKFDHNKEDVEFAKLTLKEGGW